MGALQAATILLRDRDRIYGSCFENRVRGMGIEQVLMAPRSLWQNPFVERGIGSIRRECLDHVLVLGEAHLLRVLRSCAEMTLLTATGLLALRPNSGLASAANLEP